MNVCFVVCSTSEKAAQDVCVHVSKLDKTVTLAGKLMWVDAAEALVLVQKVSVCVFMTSLPLIHH